MKRPKIPDELARKGESIYKDNGYSSFSELVRDSLRRRIEELESNTDGNSNNVITTREIFEPNGIKIGKNPQTGNSVRINLSENHVNVGITGKIASGKTATAKLLIKRMAENNSNNKFCIIDPLQQYEELYHWYSMNVSQSTEIVKIKKDTTPNPFELVPHDLIKNRNNTDKDSALFATHNSYVQTFFETQFDGNNYTINDEDMNVLQMALQSVYKSNNSFSMSSLQNTLIDIIENPKHYQDVNESLLQTKSAELLKQLVKLKGEITLETFDLKDMTVFDCSEANSGYGEAAMYSSLLSAISHAYQSDTNMTIVIDEAHILLANEKMRGVISTLLRHLRHYDAQAIILTQSPDRFLEEPVLRDNLQLKITHQISSNNIYPELSNAEIEFLRTCRTGRPESDFSEALVNYKNDKSQVKIQPNDEIEINAI